jgi:hypothetical protein
MRTNVRISGWNWVSSETESAPGASGVPPPQAARTNAHANDSNLFKGHLLDGLKWESREREEPEL